MNKLFNLVLLCFVVTLTASCDSATSTSEIDAVSASASGSQTLNCNPTLHGVTPRGELQMRQCTNGIISGGGNIEITELITEDSQTRTFIAPENLHPECKKNENTPTSTLVYNLVAGITHPAGPDNPCDLFFPWQMDEHTTYLVRPTNSSTDRFLFRPNSDINAPDTRPVFYDEEGDGSDLFLFYLECDNAARCIAPTNTNVGKNAVTGNVPAKHEYDIGYGTVTSSNSSYGIMTVTGGTGGFSSLSADISYLLFIQHINRRTKPSFCWPEYKSSWCH